MRICRLTARQFLTFEELTCDLDRHLNVVVGPNGAGKTNLLRVVAVVDEAVRAVATGNAGQLNLEYGAAGRFGADAWAASITVEFDDAELAVVRDWLMGCLVTAVQGLGLSARRAMTLIERADSEDAERLFRRGVLEVDFDRARRTPWAVTWIGQSESGSSGPPVKLDLRTNLTSCGVDKGQRHQYGQAFRDALLEAQQAEDMPSGLDRAYPGTFTAPSVVELTTTGSIELSMTQTDAEREPESVRRVLDLLDVPSSPHRIVGFAALVHYLLSRTVTVTDNVRHLPRRRWSAGDMGRPASLASGENLALVLSQLKNGDADDRGTFTQIQSVFRRLTARQADLDVTVGTDPTDDPESGVLTLLPVVTDNGRDIPLHLSGAGTSEIALLAALLGMPMDVLVLDEPAANLSPTAQRQLGATVRQRALTGGQTILITHSGHLVPAPLPRLIRVQPHSTRGSVVYQLDSDSGLIDRAGAIPADVRDAMFAAGVLLVEGDTEAAAFRNWLANLDPSPETAGVLVVPVDGDTQFPDHMRSLDALGVPWAAIVDGPALRNVLHRYDADAPRDDFSEAVRFWEERGVHTLAEEFGIGDRQGHGEIERYFTDVDPGLWLSVRGLTHSKVRRAKMFTSTAPTPTLISDIWRRVLARFDSVGQVIAR